MRYFILFLIIFWWTFLGINTVLSISSNEPHTPITLESESLKKQQKENGSSTKKISPYESELKYFRETVTFILDNPELKLTVKKQRFALTELEYSQIKTEYDIDSTDFGKIYELKHEDDQGLVYKLISSLDAKDGFVYEIQSQSTNHKYVYNESDEDIEPMKKNLIEHLDMVNNTLNTGMMSEQNKAELAKQQAEEEAKAEEKAQAEEKAEKNRLDSLAEVSINLSEEFSEIRGKYTKLFKPVELFSLTNKWYLDAINEGELEVVKLPVRAKKMDSLHVIRRSDFLSEYDLKEYSNRYQTPIEISGIPLNGDRYTVIYNADGTGYGFLIAREFENQPLVRICWVELTHRKGENHVFAGEFNRNMFAVKQKQEFVELSSELLKSINNELSKYQPNYEKNLKNRFKLLKS